LYRPPVIFAPLLTSAVLFAAQPQALPATADVLKTLRSIESSILRGQQDARRVELREQARSRPGDVMLRIYIAWCSMPSDESWNEFKAIAAINPENPWVHYGMARVYTRWKMRDQATNAYNLALKQSARFYPAVVGQGEMARAASNLDEAEKQYRAALAIADDAEAHAGLGLVQVARGKAADGKAELIKAIALWGDQPEVLHALGRIYRDEKDLKNAADTLARLTDLSPRDADARKALADLRFETGEKEQAALEYERFLRLAPPDVEIFKRLAAIYRELNKAEAEERTEQQLSAREKSDASHPLRIAELAEARGDADAAEAQLLEAAERDPKLGSVHLKLGKLRAKKGNLREALESFRAAVALGGAEAAEADAQARELSRQFKVPAKPARGSVDKIYSSVSGSLYQLYGERQKDKPDLAGKLKIRVRVDKDGKVLGVDPLEDTLNDPLIAGHVYFALKDAEYPKAKREPIFEFELKPRKK
jgi:tetratricopeptide (TPR) repeat protein